MESVQSTSQSTPELTPQSTSGPTPQSTSEPTLQSTPEPTLQSTSESSSQPTSESSSDPVLSGDQELANISAIGEPNIVPELRPGDIIDLAKMCFPKWIAACVPEAVIKAAEEFIAKDPKVAAFGRKSGIFEKQYKLEYKSYEALVTFEELMNIRIIMKYVIGKFHILNDEELATINGEGNMEFLQKHLSPDSVDRDHASYKCILKKCTHASSEMILYRTILSLVVHILNNADIVKYIQKLAQSHTRKFIDGVIILMCNLVDFDYFSVYWKNLGCGTGTISLIFNVLPRIIITIFGGRKPNARWRKRSLESHPDEPPQQVPRTTEVLVANILTTLATNTPATDLP